MAQDPSESSGCRLLVVDDNELVREGIVAIASRHAGCHVCGCASDEHSAADLIEQKHPQLCSVSLFLRHRDGISLVKNFSKRFPKLRIIVHSVDGEELYGPRLLQAGACAFLRARATAAEVVAVISEICHECENESNGRGRNGRSFRTLPTRQGVDTLTDRELHVFRLIGRGLGTGRIACELGLSRKTVEYYREQLKKKLGYPDGEALVQAAIGFVRSQRHDNGMSAA